ncbi:MAG: hypothetical protein AAGG50_06925 [Bacteroidota bacterium]
MALSDSVDRLRDLAANILPRESERPDARRRTLAVLFSLLVAFVLWFSVSMDEDYALTIDMPVAVRQLPEGQALRVPPNSPARVTVQGRGWDLLALSRNPPVLALDVEEERVNLLSAANETGVLPTGVRVQGIAPMTLALALDEEVERRLPIRLRGTVELDADYEFLDAPRLQPDSVRVVGARSVLRDLDYVPTRLVEYEDVDQSFATMVSLADTLRGLVEADLTVTQLMVRVARFTEATRSLDVRVSGIPPGVRSVRLLPGRVTATYRVPVDETLFERARTTDDFYAFVPYAEIARDTTGTVRPIPQLPGDIPLLDVTLDPARLRYYTGVE